MSYNTQETSEFVSQAKSTGPDLIHSFWSALIQTENFGLLRKSVDGTKAIRNISHAVDWKYRIHYYLGLQLKSQFL